MVPHPDIERFDQLLGQILEHVTGLRKRIKELQKENQTLKARLRQMQSGQEDIFSAISDTERITLKHTIRQMVDRIDRHLGRKEEP